MNRGELYRALRAEFGERVISNSYALTVDTNGDSVEVYFQEADNVFCIEGIAVSNGLTVRIEQEYETLSEVIAQVRKLIALPDGLNSYEEMVALIGGNRFISKRRKAASPLAGEPN